MPLPTLIAANGFFERIAATFQIAAFSSFQFEMMLDGETPLGAFFSLNFDSKSRQYLKRAGTINAFVLHEIAERNIE